MPIALSICKQEAPHQRNLSWRRGRAVPGRVTQEVALVEWGPEHVSCTLLSPRAVPPGLGHSNGAAKGGGSISQAPFACWGSSRGMLGGITERCSPYGDGIGFLFPCFAAGHAADVRGTMGRLGCCSGTALRIITNTPPRGAATS